MTPARWVCLDVGETLIDETRVWSAWADHLGVSRLTLMGALGAAIAAGGDHRHHLDRLAPGWEAMVPDVEGVYGDFTAADLYADAVPSLAALRAAGYRVAVIANQPARRHAELEALGVAPDVMAMSDAMGVAKPDPAFFRRALNLMGDPDPGDVAYVGDRDDNDVLPASAAGLRPVWLRRGPWGVLQEPPRDIGPFLEVHSLEELVRRVDGIWEQGVLGT